jgi:hypothetical protein
VRRYKYGSEQLREVRKYVRAGRIVSEWSLCLQPDNFLRGSAGRR